MAAFLVALRYSMYNRGYALNIFNAMISIFCRDPYFILSILSICHSVPCHIVHLSSASALPILREARSKGAPITVETTHHYLSLTAEGVDRKSVV